MSHQARVHIGFFRFRRYRRLLLYGFGCADKGRKEQTNVFFGRLPNMVYQATSHFRFLHVRHHRCRLLLGHGG
jgi:hypothetical protein